MELPLSQQIRIITSAKNEIDSFNTKLHEMLSKIEGTEKIFEAINNAINEAASLEIACNDAINERV